MSAMAAAFADSYVATSTVQKAKTTELVGGSKLNISIITLVQNSSDRLAPALAA